MQQEEIISEKPEVQEHTHVSTSQSNTRRRGSNTSVIKIENLDNKD